MGVLAFLAVASFGLMPVWFVAGWNVFSALEGLAFYATLLFLPGIFFGALLGVRTYRTDRRRAARAGAAIGALVGWTGFVSLIWLENVTAAGWGAGIFYWLAVPPVLAAGILVLYALFSSEQDLQRRRSLVLIGAILAGPPGVLLLAANFGLLQVVFASISTLAGAGGGWTAGVGYARAGGEEMLPPKESSSAFGR